MNSFFLFFLTIFISSGAAYAEFITCQGKNEFGRDVELIVNMDKKKSTLRTYYSSDRTSGSVLHGLDLHGKRVWKNESTLQYKSLLNSMNDYLQIKLNDSGDILEALFNKPLSGFKNILVDCKMSGTLPPAPLCAVNADSELFSLIKSNASLEEMEWIINCGADVNAKDKWGCRPLLTLFDSGCGQKNAVTHAPAGGLFSHTGAIADLLMSNGALIDARDPVNQESALIKAVKYGAKDFVESFLAGEADFNAQDAEGFTAIMHAVVRGDKWLVQDLLEGNPDLQLKNKKGQTALDLAKQMKREDIIPMVKTPDRSVTIKGLSDGSCSPLAIELKKNEIVEFILEADSRMFLIESSELQLEIMADRDSKAKKIMTMDKEGEFEFSCGIHGGALAKGRITVHD